MDGDDRESNERRPSTFDGFGIGRCGALDVDLRGARSRLKVRIVRSPGCQVIATSANPFPAHGVRRRVNRSEQRCALKELYLLDRSITIGSLGTQSDVCRRGELLAARGRGQRNGGRIPFFSLREELRRQGYRAAKDQVTETNCPSELIEHHSSFPILYAQSASTPLTSEREEVKISDSCLYQIRRSARTIKLDHLPFGVSR